LKPPKVPPAVSLVLQPYAFVGPRLPEGTYTVKLIKGKETLTSQIRLVGDPRSPHPAEDRALQQKTALELFAMLERLSFAVDSILDLQKQADARAEKLSKGSGTRMKLAGFRERLESLRKTLVATKEAGWLSGEEQLRERLGSLYGGVNGYDGRPTNSQLSRMAVLEKELAAAQGRLTAILEKELPPVNRALPEGEALKALSREEWEKKEGKG